MGQPPQILTCSIMEKPHRGLDECPRILLSCIRARISASSFHHHIMAPRPRELSSSWSGWARRQRGRTVCDRNRSGRKNSQNLSWNTVWVGSQVAFNLTRIFHKYTGRHSTLIPIFGWHQNKSSSGWWAATVSSYCPHRPSQLSIWCQQNIGIKVMCHPVDSLISRTYFVFLWPFWPLRVKRASFDPL